MTVIHPLQTQNMVLVVIISSDLILQNSNRTKLITGYWFDATRLHTFTGTSAGLISGRGLDGHLHGEPWGLLQDGAYFMCGAKYRKYGTAGSSSKVGRLEGSHGLI